MPSPYTSPVAQSVPFDNSTNGFAAEECQAAIEEAPNKALILARSQMRSCYNGTVNNNTWLGPNELLPNTPLFVFAVKSAINEITWSNQNIKRAFVIKFYKNGKTATNLIYTMTVTSPNNGYGYLSGLNLQFNPGDVLYAYITTTTAPSDMDLMLWISRLQA